MLSSLALIPILIHLFNRQRLKRIQFSSVRYLKSLQKTRMRRLKIKQLILLILRTLIILLLVIAFARPTTEGSYSSALGSAAQASIVIMIDNSLSMSTESQEGTLFETARQDALGIIDNFAPKDEIALISFSTAPSLESGGFTTNHGLVEDLLNEIEPTMMDTDPREAMEMAFELLSGSDNLVKEIYLFSDMAGTPWNGADFSQLRQLENLKIYTARLIKEDYDNLKISKVDFGNSLIYPGRPANISASVFNESPRRVDNLLVSLYVDNKRIAQADLTLGASSSEKVNFTHTFTEAGEHSGYLEISDDDLIEDNRVYFSINIPDIIRVLTLYEKEDDDLFLRMAFRPLPESPTQVELTSEPISRLSNIDLVDYDCVIVSNSKFLSQANLSRLAGFIKSGGSLLTFISDDNNKAALNEKIMIPAFESEIESGLNVKEGEGFFKLSSLDFGHPIFSRFGEIEEDYLPQMDFYRIIQVTNPQNGRVLASYSTGSPAIIESQWGRGKIIAFMSSASAEDSDLISHPFFVTFLNRAAEYLAYDLNRLRENYYTGQTISRTILHVKPEKTVELVTPDGKRLNPAYNFSGTALNLTIPKIESNGISEIVIDDNVVERFSVNFPPDETSGTFMKIGEFRDIMAGYEIIELPGGEDHAQIIQESRLGKELSRLFFILALILLAAEMLLARGSARPQPEAA